jgi:7-cyano-7-deazaguanine synthase
MPDRNRSVAVLVSGGLDSAVLLGTVLDEYAAVHPIYVRCGLAWEAVEQRFLDPFLAAIARQALKPLVTLEVPVADLYGAHWSTTGQQVPGPETPDEAVYLPGRNVLLLGKSLLWCHLHEVPALALATLARNPFPDATPEFFTSFAATVNRAIGGDVRILTPFAGLTKADVVSRGRHLPLQHTMSCLQPTDVRHCGNCNKCAERRTAFREVGMPDPTSFFAPGH